MVRARTVRARPAGVEDLGILVSPRGNETDACPPARRACDAPAVVVDIVAKIAVIADVVDICAAHV